MELNFFDNPNHVPHTRENMKILELNAAPYEDRQRVRIDIQVTPFAPVDKPNLEIEATNNQGSSVASLTIIETVNTRLSVTIHLREDEPSGTYTINASLYYDDSLPQHTLSNTFTI